VWNLSDGYQFSPDTEKADKKLKNQVALTRYPKRRCADSLLHVVQAEVVI